VDALEFVVRHGYTIVFVVVLGEQLGLPLLGAPVLLAAGALSATGRFLPHGALALAVGACLIGDLVWYQLGRRRGASVLTFLCRIALEPDSCVRRTEEIFARHGARVLLVAKFVPGLNAVAPPLSGVVGMPLARFVRFDAGGALLWAGTYLGLGYLFSTQLEMVAMGLAELGRGAGAVVGLAVVGYIGAKYYQRRRFLRQLRMARITPEELMERMTAGETVLVVDLRSDVHAGAEGTRLPGALHFHPDELERRHQDIPRDRGIVLYCS